MEGQDYVLTVTRMDSIPVVSEDPHVQRAYVEMLANGTSHALAEMFALRQPPMSNTDREFQEGRCNGNQFEKTPWVGDRYRKEATRAGVDTTGRYYEAQLATYPGDPQAWVGGRGDVQRVCEQRGLDCEGSVKVKAYEPTQFKSVAVADDLVESVVESRIEQDPGLAEKPREEVKEQVLNRIKPHWSK